MIDLTAERNKRNGPDSDCLKQDREGRTLKLFAIDYQMEDGTFTFEMWATDWADAERRVRCIRDSAGVAGIVHSRMQI